MIIALVEHIAFSARRRWAPHSNQAAFSSNRKLQTAGGRGSVCYGATAHTLNAPHSWRPALFNTACMQWRIPLVWLEKWSFSVQKHENTFARVFMCFVRDLNSLCSHRKFFNVFILKKHFNLLKIVEVKDFEWSWPGLLMGVEFAPNCLFKSCLHPTRLKWMSGACWETSNHLL